MQEILRKLEQVQEIDLQISAILRKKSDYPVRLSKYDQEIKTHTAKFDEKKRIVDELEKNKRQQLGALELNEERSKRSQEKLEQIKTNTEYQALQKEIESLKKNSAVIQENANKVNEEIEKHRKELDAFKAALDATQSKRDAEAAQISGETGGLEAELGRLNSLRKDAIVGIDARYLSAYDRVRSGRGGLGIVPAIAGNCRGCNMRIPPQIYNELQRGTEIHACPSCKRILVYKDQSKGVAASANG